MSMAVKPSQTASVWGLEHFALNGGDKCSSYYDNLNPWGKNHWPPLTRLTDSRTLWAWCHRENSLTNWIVVIQSTVSHFTGLSFLMSCWQRSVNNLLSYCPLISEVPFHFSIQFCSYNNIKFRFLYMHFGKRMIFMWLTHTTTQCWQQDLYLP